LVEIWKGELEGDLGLLGTSLALVEIWKAEAVKDKLGVHHNLPIYHDIGVAELFTFQGF
jgi:hypothetical protein